MNERTNERAVAATARQSLVAEESARREAAWSPKARWLAIQRTIFWAEAQSSVRRNTPAACLERQRCLLANHR